MNNDRTDDGDKEDLGSCELHNLQDHLGRHGRTMGHAGQENGDINSGVADKVG